MPQCQFLFSAVFGFRNPSKEIFSESDEINAKDLRIPGSIQNTREPPEEGLVGPTGVASRLIRLQRIYNFLCSMLVLCQYLHVLFTLYNVFMHFLGLTY